MTDRSQTFRSDRVEVNQHLIGPPTRDGSPVLRAKAYETMSRIARVLSQKPSVVTSSCLAVDSLRTLTIQRWPSDADVVSTIGRSPGVPFSELERRVFVVAHQVSAGVQHPSMTSSDGPDDLSECQQRPHERSGAQLRNGREIANLVPKFPRGRALSPCRPHDMAKTRTRPSSPAKLWLGMCKTSSTAMSFRMLASTED